MLDLDARVHLHEVEAAIRVEQELDGAGVDIAHAAHRLERGLTHRLARFLVDDGTGRLLNELLVTALNRAIALAEVHGVAMRIGDDLNLHMTRTADEFLEIDLVVAEGRWPPRYARRRTSSRARRRHWPHACPCRRRQPMP